MEIIVQTQDELVVSHREPTSRIFMVSVCLSFILLMPILIPRLSPGILGIPIGVEMLLIGLFVVVVIFALQIYKSHETYSFSQSRHTYSIYRAGPFGQKTRTGKISEIKAVYEESYPDDDMLKELVILVLSDGTKIRLPWHSLSFTAAERSRLGASVARFLDLPIRVDIC